MSKSKSQVCLLCNNATCPGKRQQPCSFETKDAKMKRMAALESKNKDQISVNIAAAEEDLSYTGYTGGLCLQIKMSEDLIVIYKGDLQRAKSAASDPQDKNVLFWENTIKFEQSRIDYNRKLLDCYLDKGVRRKY